MGKLSFEEFRDAVEGKTIEDFIKEVKGLVAYDVYKKEVKKGKANTALPLQISVMMCAFSDSKLDALMNRVSMDLLFAMVDQRLRNEILNESEVQNED